MSKVEPNLVYPNRFSEMTLVLDGDVPFSYRDFVVTFNFFDESGKEMAETEIGAEQSQKLGCFFRYLKPSDNGLGADAIRPFQLLHPAASARVEIRPWKNRSADAAKEMQGRVFVCAKSSESGKVWTRRIGSK